MGSTLSEVAMSWTKDRKKGERFNYKKEKGKNERPKKEGRQKPISRG